MLLQNTKKLEKETEEFIDKFIRIALVFEEAVKSYFSGNSESFSHYIQESDKLESDVDHIRKDIELSLYSKMLIPESRGDVFKILESMDDVADQVEWLIREYDIEKPHFPDNLTSDMLKIADLTKSCIEALVKAVTAFFKGTEEHSVHIQKVKFYEGEIDILEESAKRKIFSGKTVDTLAEKMQLKSFVENTCDISDFAEEVCEYLAISIVKRSI